MNLLKRPRVKDAGHLDFIRQLPCACCGNNIETEAAHLRAGNPRYGKRPTGGAEKPSDMWAIPLCSSHHRQQHKIAELKFWVDANINPFVLALSLYGASGNHAVAEEIIELQRHR